MDKVNIYSNVHKNNFMIKEKLIKKVSNNLKFSRDLMN